MRLVFIISAIKDFSATSGTLICAKIARSDRASRSMQQMTQDQVLRQPMPYSCAPSTVRIGLARRCDIGISGRLDHMVGFGIVPPRRLMLHRHADTSLRVSKAGRIDRLPLLFGCSLATGESCIRKARANDTQLLAISSFVIHIDQHFVPAGVELRSQRVQ